MDALSFYGCQAVRAVVIDISDDKVGSLNAVTGPKRQTPARDKGALAKEGISRGYVG